MSDSKPQSRVIAGHAGQQAVISHLASTYGDQFILVSTSVPSSRAPDIIAEVQGNRIQIEVKSQSSSKSLLTLIDKSIRRGQGHGIFDEIALNHPLVSATTFEQLIDHYRGENQSVGFPGDDGCPKSGKIPPEISMIDHPLSLVNIRQRLLEKLTSNGDNYLAIVNHDGTIKLMWTSHGDNHLVAPIIPLVKRAKLDTYGGSYSGAMRVALKVEFE